jgi:E3 ubiquitin-protein ligase HUWE1
LLAFHAQGGLDILNAMLRAFSKEMSKEPVAPSDSKVKVASFGLRKILDLYAWFVNGKAISDSSGHFTLLPRTGDRRSDTSIVQQVTLEFRAAILPVVREIWESSMIERASDAILRGVIDILKTISTGDHEPASHRSDGVSSKFCLTS